MLRLIILTASFAVISVQAFACDFQSAGQMAAERINAMAKRQGATKFTVGPGFFNGQLYSFPFFFDGAEGKTLVGTSEVNGKSCQFEQASYGDGTESSVQ